jgi:anaerobic magnesium-protoporphyrin IX monomethyl ester cyclase
MKVLFINPPADNMLSTEVPEFLSEERGCNPSLGILYLASSLEGEGHEVSIVDAQVDELEYGDIKNKVSSINPDVVGVTAMSFTLIDCLLTAETVKQVDDGIKVVFGGPHPTIYPDETVKLEHVDYAVIGEGEHTMVKLVEALEKRTPPSGIRGIAYLEGGRPKNTGMSPYIEDLDILPFPARKLIPYKKYTSLLSRRNPVTTMFTSRGCPYKCLFCDRPQMGKVFRARSAQNVVDEMVECIELGINEFLIYDDTFTVDRQRVLDICSEIRKQNLDVGWDVRARVNTVDKNLLQAMRSAGCERIHYGVEAGNPEILKTLRKGITLQQVEKAFSDTKAAGIETLAYFMIGSPGETPHTIQESIDLAKKLDPGYVHFSITTPFPATDLYRMAQDEGVVKSDVWLEYAKNPTKDFVPPLWEENMSRDELIALLHKAYKSFYLRPSYVFERLMRIRSPEELMRKVRAGLKVIGI